MGMTSSIASMVEPSLWPTPLPNICGIMIHAEEPFWRNSLDHYARDSAMAKRATFFDFAFIDTKPVRPLHRWLSEQVRAAVLDGRLQPGTRLPSSRAFAQQYGLARGTVVDVFAQLVAEGYIHSKVGAGTYVLPALPDTLLKAAPSRAFLPATCPRARQAQLSQRGAALVHTPFPRSRPQEAGLLFDPYQPALEAFPARLW